MADIVTRMRWWAAKRKAPKGMPTLLADCAEAADEIELWKSSSEAWTKSSVDMHRRAQKAEARYAKLAQAASAVIAQWDTPNWKLTEPTAKLINELRAALDQDKGGGTDG